MMNELVNVTMTTNNEKVNNTFSHELVKSFFVRDGFTKLYESVRSCNYVGVGINSKTSNEFSVNINKSIVHIFCTDYIYKYVNDFYKSLVNSNDEIGSTVYDEMKNNVFFIGDYKHSISERTRIKQIDCKSVNALSYIVRIVSSMK